MLTPLIIQYSQNNLNSLGDNYKAVLSALQGRHSCHFYYEEPQKSHSRVRITINGQKYGIIAEFSEKEQLCLCNPWFRDERTMDPVNEDDGIKQDCHIVFGTYRQNPYQLVIENNLHNQLPAAIELLKRCRKIPKPVVPVHSEEEKEIWTAYCDGLLALNKERREFIKVDSFGKPILYSDTRQGDIYTIKLGVDKDYLNEIPKKVKQILRSKYSIPETNFSVDNNLCSIVFKGTEKILEGDLEELCDCFHKYGYKITSDGPVDILTAIVYLSELKNRDDLYNQLDDELVKKGIGFSNNENLEYLLENDASAASFIDIADEVFKGLGHAVKKNCILHEMILTRSLSDTIRENLDSNSRMGVSKKGLWFYPVDSDDYEILKTRMSDILSGLNIKANYPPYKATCIISTVDDDMSLRREIMQKAESVLADYKNLAYNYEYNQEKARAIRLDFRFSSSHEREHLSNSLSSLVKSLGYEFSLKIKDPLGNTSIYFERDKTCIQQLEEELKTNYQNEDIRLVDGQIYNDLFKDVTDPENIVDPILRDQYNRFMNECPLIGTCHKRTLDYVIVNLSEDFFNGERMSQQIKAGDMIFYPSVGSSTQLRRQYDAIQRINKPGAKLSNGHKIDPPVNPQLCSFLFSPLFARDIKSDIRQMMDNIRKNKLEDQLNDKQIEAVAKSVLAEDIAFIQGPPGTGKTTVIAEIIWQEIRRNPACKILLTSQTNLAVDNALERLKYKRAIRPLRVISEMRADLDDILYNSNILDNWVEKPNEYTKGNVVENWMDSICARISTDGPYAEITKEWRDLLEKKDKASRKEFVDLYKANVNLIASTCSLCGSQQFFQTFSRMYNTEEMSFDVVIMDEASKATPLEMAIPMVLGKKIIVIGDHKQLPPLMDENSIDTALRKIGRDDLALKIQSLKESQFKKLFMMAQKFRPNLVTTLDTQYRMHKDIMLTINQFYVDELGEKGLKCGIEKVQNTPDFTVKGSRWHGISLDPFISPETHAIWVNVEGREEKDGTSYKNQDEVHAIETVMKALSRNSDFQDYINAQKRMEDKEIGIITFYSSQKRELRNLEKKGGLDPMLDYRIEVVDRFQGMERNIIIVSTVRSNSYNGIGFAKEIERINVAFSRARSLLIVVGNRDLFATKYNYRDSIAAMESIDIKQIEHLIRQYE